MAQNKTVKYNKVEQFLSSSENKDFSNLILIYGEQYLLKQAQKLISFSLLGKNPYKKTQDNFAVETLEGGSVSMGEIIEQISTFSFFQSKKIVLVKNIPLFQTRAKLKKKL